MKTLCTLACVRKHMLYAFFCLFFLPVSAKTIYTSTGGTSGTPLNWSSSGTWTSSGSGTPVVYIIQAGHYIEFNANNSSPYVDTLFHYGDLLMGNNKIMTLTASGVLQLMNATARITGGSANTQFQWNGTSAVLTGPFTSGNEITGGPRYATAATVNAAAGNIQSSFVYGMLPVSLLGFDVDCEKDGLDIQWHTVSETNLQEFVIYGSADNNEWKTISTIEAAGESGQLRSYNFRYSQAKEKNRDSQVLQYFRLKTIDKNGGYEFSETIWNRCDASRQPDGFAISVTPNPAIYSQVISVDAQEPGDYTLAIYSENGRLVKTYPMKADRAGDILSVVLTEFEPGIYTARVTSPSDTRSINLHWQ